jgi:hypothetical protein
MTEVKTCRFSDFDSKPVCKTAALCTRVSWSRQALTGRDIHGLPKVSPGPAMPDPYTPCGRAIPPNRLMAVWGVARPQGGRPAAIFFPLGYPFPYGPGSRDWVGEFHDQGDAKWIVIRGQLRGHNDMPFGRPTPGRPIGRPGVGRSHGVFGVLSYYD